MMRDKIDIFVAGFLEWSLYENEQVMFCQLADRFQQSSNIRASSDGVSNLRGRGMIKGITTAQIVKIAM